MMELTKQQKPDQMPEEEMDDYDLFTESPGKEETQMDLLAGAFNTFLTLSTSSMQALYNKRLRPHIANFNLATASHTSTLEGDVSLHYVHAS